MDLQEILADWPKLVERCALFGLSPSIRDGAVVLTVTDPCRFVAEVYVR